MDQSKIIALISIGVVFAALIVLVLCYTLIGAICTGKFRLPWRKKAGASKTGAAADGAGAAAAENERAAAIAMALQLYLGESVHDEESYIITIKRKR